MVKLRLRRVGAKKQPHYRVVVADSKSPRDGKFIETIGYYNPRTEPPTVEIDAERALYWLSVGAQPSAAVKRMLDKLGLMSKVAAVRTGEEAVEEILAQITPAEVEEEALPEVEEELPAEEEALEESPVEVEEETLEEEPEAAEDADLDDDEADDVDED